MMAEASPAPASSSALAAFLDRWVESGEVTAAFALVATRERTVWSGGAVDGGVAAMPGADSSPAPPTVSSLFDAASLTKPWIATLALALEATGELPLDLALGEIWPGCAPAIATTPLSQLLRHRAGFQAWTPF